MAKKRSSRCDESFVGGLEKNKHSSKRKHKGTGGVGKEAVFSLVERGGRVHSHHVQEVNANTLRPILQAQVDGKTFAMTDEGGAAKKVGSEFERHDSVNHSIGETSTRKRRRRTRPFATSSTRIASRITRRK